MPETTTVSSKKLRNAEEILVFVPAFYWPQIKVNIYIKMINEHRKLVLELDTVNIAQSGVCIRSQVPKTSDNRHISTSHV